MVSITSFYIFYLIHTFDLTVQSAQLYLFLFLGAVAAGTVQPTRRATCDIGRPKRILGVGVRLETGCA